MHITAVPTHTIVLFVTNCLYLFVFIKSITIMTSGTCFMFICITSFVRNAGHAMYVK